MPFAKYIFKQHFSATRQASYSRHEIGSAEVFRKINFDLRRTIFVNGGEYAPYSDEDTNRSRGSFPIFCDQPPHSAILRLLGKLPARCRPAQQSSLTWTIRRRRAIIVWHPWARRLPARLRGAAR